MAMAAGLVRSACLSGVFKSLNICSAVGVLLELLELLKLLKLFSQRRSEPLGKSEKIATKEI